MVSDQLRSEVDAEQFEGAGLEGRWTDAEIDAAAARYEAEQERERA